MQKYTNITIVGVSKADWRVFKANFILNILYFILYSHNL